MCRLGGVLACTSRCTSCRSYNSPCVRSCRQARQKDGDRGLVDNERDSAPPVQFLSREPLPRLSGEESGMLCVQLDPTPSSSSPLFPIIATAPSMTRDAGPRTGLIGLLTKQSRQGSVSASREILRVRGFNKGFTIGVTAGRIEACARGRKL